MQQKRVVVTGGLGFIGSYFVQLLLDRGYHVINIDKKTYAARNDINFEKNHSYEWLKEDISFLPSLPEQIDFIVNFAAESHVDNSITGNRIFFDSNTLGVYNLLEIIRMMPKENRPLFVQVSTDEVYGEVASGARLEKDELRPSNPYSATKAAAEQMIFGWSRTYDIRFIICRSSNNYGWGQHVEKLIPRTMSLISQNQPMTVHGSGEYMREWTFAGDNCDGILLAMEQGTPNSVYNISSNEIHSNIDVIKAILELMGGSVESISYTENRPGQDSRYSIDSTLIRTLGWMPKMKLFDYLPSYIKQFKQSLL